MAKTRPAGTVSAKQLADVLDCSTRQVEKYCEEGLVIRVERGAYHFLSSIRNVVTHLRKQAGNNMASNGAQSVADENILFRRSQRKLSELRIAQLEGTLITMAEIEESWAALVAANRQLMLSLPGRYRLENPGASGHDQAILQKLCHDMLSETALGEGRRPAVKGAAPALPEDDLAA